MNIFSIAGCMIIAMIILLAGLIMVRIAKIKTKTTPSDVKTMVAGNYKKQYIAGMIISIIMIVCGIGIGITAAIADSHGMPSEDYTGISIAKAIHSIANSPVESKMDTDDVPGGTIILYYKFGCKDCEAVYKDLKAQTKDIADVYWISTESKTGETLLDKYPVTEVPSGVYVRNHTLSGSVTFSKFVLYTTDQDGNTVLNNDTYYGLPRLLSMKENEK